MFDAGTEETHVRLGGVIVSGNLEYLAVTKGVVSDEISPDPAVRRANASYEVGVRCLGETSGWVFDPQHAMSRHPGRPGNSVEVPGSVGVVAVRPPAGGWEFEGRRSGVARHVRRDPTTRVCAP